MPPLTYFQHAHLRRARRPEADAGGGAGRHGGAAQEGDPGTAGHLRGFVQVSCFEFVLCIIRITSNYAGMYVYVNDVNIL